MSPRIAIVFKAVIGISLAAAWSGLAAPQATSTPAAGGYRDEPQPVCTIDIFGPDLPKQFLPVPGDPTGYVSCAQGAAFGGSLLHCRVGTFSDEEQACVRQGGSDTISVDYISQQPNDPPTTIDVGLTYSGQDLDHIQVKAADTTDSSKFAVYASPPGALTSDGQPHAISVPADRNNYAFPALNGAWQPQPGEEIQIEVQLFNIQHPPNPLAAPILIAGATRTFTIPGVPDSPGPTPPSEPPKPLPAVTQWSGTWASGRSSAPATLTLDAIGSLNGTIGIQGLCSAQWTETRRFSDTSREVAAHVNPGTNCRDNKWNITIGQDEITGYDVMNAANTITLTPQ